MTRTLSFLAILTLALPLVATAQSTMQSQPQLSKQQVRTLARSAHSAAEYRQLADYYRVRSSQLRAQATAELAERDRRAQFTMGTAQKYPRPVDSAQYLYDSLTEQADQAAAQAQHYDQLAGATKS
jgi:hypothetical protein